MVGTVRRTRRRWALLAWLVIAGSVVGPTRVSQAADECKIPNLTWTHTDANNPLVMPGTRISFSSECASASQVPYRVEVSDGGGSKLFLLDGLTNGSEGLRSATDIYIPVRGAEVCVTVDELEVCKEISLQPGDGSDANTPPSASFETDCVDLTCTFTDTSGDPDPDGSISTWAWDFDGDGTVDSGDKDPSHSYSAAGTYDVVLTVTDNGGATGSTTDSVTVYAPLTIDTTSLPAAKKKVAYSTNLEASGGRPPYSWSVVSGALPKGLSLASDGALTGTPKTPGTYSFTVQVADAQVPGKSASRTLAIQVDPR